MSDIFDEVDDILNEVSDEMAAEVTDVTDVEKNFNESELQDIMAEIESLEKEFDTEEVVAVAEPIVTPVRKTELQNEIDRELEMSFVEKEEAEIESATKVLTFDKKNTATTSTDISGAKSSEISFEAHGQMNLNLGFKIGDENAKLTIDPVKGLVVTMSGVKLCINQEDGCIVTMENGVKFTIPLTSAESNLKKKSA